MQYGLSGAMTRHGGLYNTYYTRCNSIGTYGMVGPAGLTGDRHKLWTSHQFITSYA